MPELTIDVTRTIERFGAARNLTVSGNPADVEMEVNRLYNWGIVTNIPETYNPEIDMRVFLQSDEGRLNRGFLAMAITKLQADKNFCASLRAPRLPYTRHLKGVNSQRFLERAREVANEYLAEFEPTDTIYEDPIERAGHVYGFTGDEG